MKQGIISLGEVIVDMVSGDKANQTYQAYLGGATVNVAVGISRQGLPSYYVCKLGTDLTSDFIKKSLESENVDIRFCVYDSQKKLCKVYIHLNEKGDRIFHMYENETPNIWIKEQELQKKVFEMTKIFYFGSGTLFHPAARKMTEQALSLAKQAESLVAFDVNIRLLRWESKEECKAIITKFMVKANIVKMAEDELYFLTGTNALSEAVMIANGWNIPYLFITMGEKGALLIHNGQQVAVEGLRIKAIDTTGAGDAFMAGVLYFFHEKGESLDRQSLQECLDYANLMGAKATTRIGAL